MNKLAQVVNLTKIPYFICIGTELSYIDGIAPRIGSKLSKEYRILGTLGDNLDNVTLQERIDEIESIDSAVYQVIAVDCAFHHDYRGTERLVIYNNGLRPRSYLDKNHKPIGEIGVGINVSPVVENLQDFLTPSKHRDVYDIELRVLDYLRNIRFKYPLAMQVAMMKDLGKRKSTIMSKLRLSDSEYHEEINRLKTINKAIYERMI